MQGNADDSVMMQDFVFTTRSHMYAKITLKVSKTYIYAYIYAYSFTE